MASFRASRRTSLRIILYCIAFSLSFCLPAAAADICTGTAQILLPNGTCMQGYDGAAHSNCNAVSNAVGVQTAGNSLVCTQGPACPSGYGRSMPPYFGDAKTAEVSDGLCQAICTSVFVGHGWPCSCPYGQHIGSSGKCVPICGTGAMWQHTPGAKWTETISTDNNPPATVLLADPGMCACPSGKEYVNATSSCMTPCPQGETRDAGGQCISPEPAGPKYCSNGQHVGSCQCPPTGVVHNGVCKLCQIGGQNGPGSPSQDPACKAAMGAGGGSGDGASTFTPIGTPHCAQGTHLSKLGKCVANQPACGWGMHWNGQYCVKNAL